MVKVVDKFLPLIGFFATLQNLCPRPLADTASTVRSAMGPELSGNLCRRAQCCQCGLPH
jgi:hypothetical protein